ncbi:Alpha/beta hydrolase fold-3 domain protein [Cellulomonas flavigena DSM 20109]|uniref:Alpha/beta hydrolase fold-3 domain protein n=1 Tax=Cellulomonas flavigena (strain ATCC 482 / DSM 20109 / BCRC 11376 / JCM 18109 / NBRC 3775 / NCIMB 8073 / NRS 134) TaxID=446466 RepID=D5UC82_CELFN|nr:alpha/beta hydrolase fold domain-containing protein [Cellulomonas flavigena]ADG76241.1 Alpha/beta hydrolase fold-3 domain protein [Cellulomonas flavigena DSM 20109]
MTATRPPFDPAIAAALVARAADVVTTLAPDGIAPLRARTVPPDLDEVARSCGRTLTWHTVPGSGASPDGDVRVALLRPPGAGPAPLLLHLHGGGLVLGTVADDVAVVASSAPGWAIASVDYRLAPEHPYPAAVEDAYAGLLGVVAQADELGLDAGCVVVTGVSAGAGLAAALALLVRDRGGPGLAGQLLVCPMLDDRNDSASGHQMAGVGTWDRTANATGWAAYLPGAAGGPGTPPYASAARAASLAGLPPTYVDVGSAETFRDECVAYAARLWADGGDAELHVWPGGCHGFDGLVPDAPVSRDARHARARWLARLRERPASDAPPPAAP